MFSFVSFRPKGEIPYTSCRLKKVRYFPSCHFDRREKSPLQAGNSKKSNIFLRVISTEGRNPLYKLGTQKSSIFSFVSFRPKGEIPFTSWKLKKVRYLLCNNIYSHIPSHQSVPSEKIIIHFKNLVNRKSYGHYSFSSLPGLF